MQHALSHHAAMNDPQRRRARWLRRVPPIVAWLPLAILPAAVGVIGWSWTGWVYMWALCGALYVGCKWLTLTDALRTGVTTNTRRTLGYLLAYPGMNAERFLETRRGASVPLPRVSDWLAALIKITAGAAMLWGVAPRIQTDSLVLIGWIGMVGIILMLHFGLFDLIVFAWRSAGIDAQRVMLEPARSTSLGEFWGRRWNTAFRDLAHRYAFRPLVRKIGLRGAVFAGFVASAVVHDLSISLPAHAAFGLPSAYFLLQGAAVLFERTAVAKRLGLGRGFRGWLFVAVVTLGPAFWLFHPPFVERVIVPLMRAVGAL